MNCNSYCRTSKQITMHFKTILLPLLLFLFEFSLAQNQGYISLQNAKFITGDNPEWKQPGFIDTAWKNMRAGQVWQRQGFPDYHGYAWYRMHIVIPSSLKNNATWKDSLRIFLAHVNDVDETFLNGVKIGQIGRFPDEAGGYISKWPSVREYHIATNNPVIHWDKENVIAIRVYDGGGTGGIFMGDPYVDMLEKLDGISIGAEGNFEFHDKIVQKKLNLRNEFGTTTKGKFHYTIFDAQAAKQLEDNNLSIELKPFQSKDFTITFPHKKGV